MIGKALVLGLATWRLTSLLLDESGPGGVFYHVRKRAGVYDEGELSGGLRELLSCVWCLSVWVAGILVLLRTFAPRVANVAFQALAASAIAIAVSTKVKFGD